MDVHKGSGEPAFTAEWVEEDQSVYFTSYINYKFRLNVRQLLRPICIWNLIPFTIQTRNKMRHVKHVWPKSSNPTYNMWLFHPVGKGQKIYRRKRREVAGPKVRWGNMSVFSGSVGLLCLSSSTVGTPLAELCISNGTGVDLGILIYTYI